MRLKTGYMRICVFTLVAGEEYYSAVLPGLHTKHKYCKRHGYDYLEVVDHSLPQVGGLPISWYKLHFLADILLADTYDVIFCSDADVCITNPAIKIETILQVHFPLGKDLLFSRQCVWAPYINAGNFFVRNTPWAQVFLRKWFQNGEKYESENRKFWEQAYINDMYDIYADKEVIEHVQVTCDQKLFNSFHLNWEAGDFLIHFPTLSGEHLKSAMKYGAGFVRFQKGIQEQSWFQFKGKKELKN